ncbi:glycoside hydrolase family 3 C-terminal domain-containing protein [Coprobacter sp.]
MKNQFSYLFLIVLCSCMAHVGSAQETFPFQNPDLSFEKRVDDLVARLTLEEKVAQMLNKAPAIERLGIPAYDWWNECLHGIGRTPYKVTVFPQAIGMAATWDDVTLKRVASSIADEGRAIYHDAISKGVHEIYHGLTYWTPNINIFRDPRWGRGQETYGEDPYLTGMMGKAFVYGLQGDDPKYLKASGCAKHYAVHSGPEASRHVFNTEVSPYDLWDTYLPAFRDLIVDAKVSGVMCAYNAYAGQPCCGNDMLMQDILRKQWNFAGYVTSDCGAIDDFLKHKTHADATHASADAVLHGTDLECGQNIYVKLVDAVKKGMITEAQIDESLKRLFLIRFRLGLFDPADRVKYANTPLSVLECSSHKALALKMAQESVVLLKNENVLPLQSKKLKKIAVIGPNADDSTVVLGNYNGFPSEVITPLEAIRSKVGKRTQVIYDKAVDFVKPADPKDIKSLIERLSGVDQVIFVGGISPRLEGEELPISIDGFRGGDRTTIALPDVQTQLMKELTEAGLPVIFVMMTGSALGIQWEAQNVPAILNAWYGGQFAGQAIADVLFGDYNPSGKLPVTFYREDSDLPPFGSFAMKNRTYRYFKGEPLYPFGYGLSYTIFDYAEPVLVSRVTAGKPVEVSVKVKNVGKIDGDEVVQLYITHEGIGKAPVAALKGFKRVHLKAGEEKTLLFELSPRDLALADTDGVIKIFPGKKTLYVGGVSPTAEAKSKGLIKSAIFQVSGDAYVIK